MDSKKLGFFLGLGMFVALLLIPAPAGMAVAAWRMVAITVLMATWWIMEPIPIAATSLLPIALFPLLQIVNVEGNPVNPTASYSDPVIYLFMGGFFLAIAMERWNLHTRIALTILKYAGDTPSRLIFGFVVATTFLSIWISNTATAVMMVPIGISVLSQVMSKKDAAELDAKKKKQEGNFAKSLMLTIAYSSSIGGFIAITGTPPNIILAGFLRNTYDVDVSFLQWMLISTPISLTLMVCMYFLLTRVIFPTGDLQLSGGKDVVINELKKLGPMTNPEKMTLLVGVLMASGWILREFIIQIPIFSMVTDTTIAISGGLLLFILPALKDNQKILNWEHAVKIPWGIVLLFGGGLTLASGFGGTGLAAWFSGNMAYLGGMNVLLFIFITILVINVLTEFMSNTAAAALFVPVMAVTAISIGVHPVPAAVATAIAASFAFIMPVSSPPNAIVFGSGYIGITDMMRAGVFINIAAQVLATLAIVYLLPLVWGIEITYVPQEILDMVQPG